MATSKVTVLNADALSQAKATLEGLALRMEDGEARRSFFLLTAYWRLAIRKLERGQECDHTIYRHRCFDTFHMLDEDGRALCLAEDVETSSGLLRETCDDCATLTGQLAEWDVNGWTVEGTGS